MKNATSSARGSIAEQAAARKYGLAGVDEVTGWYDLYASNGVKYEVKSAQHTRDDGTPGKFRIWRRNFEKLHRNRSAVILVITASNNPAHVLRIEKVSTSVVMDAAKGRWFRSGWRDDGMGPQARIPWTELLPR